MGNHQLRIKGSLINKTSCRTKAVIPVQILPDQVLVLVPRHQQQEVKVDLLRGVCDPDHILHRRLQARGLFQPQTARLKRNLMSAVLKGGKLRPRKVQSQAAAMTQILMRSNLLGQVGQVEQLRSLQRRPKRKRKSQPPRRKMEKLAAVLIPKFLMTAWTKTSSVMKMIVPAWKT